LFLTQGRESVGKWQKKVVVQEKQQKKQRGKTAKEEVRMM
jgi:hypothetical protein